MKPNTAAQTQFGRFHAILGGTVCTRPSYDRILFECDGCVVTPTLGSILPNWLLVIPKVPVLNFVRWQKTSGKPAQEVVQSILSGCGIASDRAIWFEHGPKSEGTIVGCGVDQAHLHILVAPPFTFSEFSAAAEQERELAWRQCSAVTAYNDLSANQSYLLACSMEQAIVATGVERAGSQFFRRLVASLAGMTGEWNYRDYPHLPNVEQTVRTFARQ